VVLAAKIRLVGGVSQISDAFFFSFSKKSFCVNKTAIFISKVEL
jgi:hypothetical protein